MKKIDRRVVSGLAALLSLLLGVGVAAAAEKAPAAKVDVNTASVEQLTALPGVGPTLAARIVEHRQKEGAFKSIQELMNVKGIGERSFQKLQPYLTVGEAPRSGGSR